MNPSSRFPRACRHVLATSIAAMLAAFHPTRAAVLTWDISPGVVGPGDGTITGGSGTWDTFSGAWTSDGGLNNVAWNNAGNDQAIFGGDGGLVSVLEPITVGAITFHSTGYSLIGSNITLGGVAPSITVDAGLSVTISSALTGTSGLIFAGGGELVLTTANTYTGGTTVNAGNLTLSVGGGTGAIRGPLTINAGAMVTTNVVDALGYTNGQCVDTVNINGGTINNATTGNQAFITNFILTGGTMASSGGGAYNFNTGFGVTTNASASTSFITAPMVIRGGSLTFTTATGTTPDGIDLAVSGVISGGANSISKAGNGTMALSANTTYTGGTTVNGGILDLNGGGGGTGVLRGRVTINAGATLRLSVADAVGFTANVSVNMLNINGGTVHVNTTGNQTFSNATVTLNAGTISGIPGSNIDLFNNGTSIATTGAATSSVISVGTMGLRQNDTVFNIADGAAPVDLLVSTSLINASGANNQGNHNLIKSGNGVMQLTGTNLYTGTTRVNAGTLSLSGTGSLASPSITVATGALFDVSGLTSGSFEIASGQTLIAGRVAGAGTDVIGNVTTGFGTIQPAGSATAGTMTIAGNLTLSGGTVSFDLSNTATVGGGVNDLINVGNLSLVGPTNIAINKLNGALGSNTYTLLKYSGTLTGDAANLILSGAAGGTTRQIFALDTLTTPGSVLLTVTGASADLVWVGDGGFNAWDVVGTSNFKSGAVPDKYYDGDTVLFDDTGSNSPSIQIVSDVAPGTLTVNNTTKDYTFVGASINGGTGLTKNGDGTLTLSSFNHFVGPVAINAGTITADSIADGGVASPLGAGTVLTLGDATHNGKLRLTGFGAMTTNRSITVNAGGGFLDVADISTSLTANGAIVINGPFIKTGNGTLTLASPVSGSGSLNVNGGTVTVTAFSSYTGDLNVNAGTFNTGVGLANGVTTSLGAGTGTRNVTIGPGATMNWTSNNILVGGGGNAANLPTITVTGGTLSSTRYNAIGNVVLNSGASLTQSATDSGNYEGYQFIGTVSAGGTAASTISSTASKANHLKGGATTVFNVADATNDANPDLTISTVIRDGSGDYAGVGALQKTGAGTLLLTASNSYTGATTVSAGTLALAPGSSLVSTAINVGNGGTLDVSAFGGYNLNTGVTLNVASGGFVAGPLSVSPGATLIAGRTSAAAADLTGNLDMSGTLTVGGAGVAGTLTLGTGAALSLNGAGVNFDLDLPLTVGGGVNDLVSVAGGLTLNGIVNISINRLNGSLSNGAYTLMTYSSLIGGPANLNLVGLVNSPRQTFALDLNTPGALRLIVDGLAGSLTWVGDGGTNAWNHTAPNWSGSADNRFLDGDSVTFSDTGSNSPDIQITEDVNPSAVFVNNSTKNYTISGIGQITGGTGLVKNGTGTLTINNFNSFTGSVTVNGGTISVPTISDIGVPSPLGAGDTIALGNATQRGTLQLSGVGAFGSSNRLINLGTVGGTIDVPDVSSTLTLNGVISGAGGFTKTGNGTLTLSVLETYTGGTVVDGGNLVLTFGGIAGTLGGTVTVNAGATLTSQVKDALGYGPARAATININGGTVSHTPATNFSVWGMTVNMTGGTLQSTDGGGQFDFGTDNNAANIPTVINTFASPNASTIAGRVNLRQANTAFTVADGAASPDLFVSATIFEGVANSGVTKAGPGSMEMTGTSTYTGVTNVDAGTLIVTGSIAASTVNVKSGAVLTGGGTVGPLSVQTGGLLAPGNGLGMLRTGNLALTAGSVLSLQIDSTAPGVGYDQLSATGAVDITGATLSLTGAYFTNSPVINDLFFILLNDDVDAITGTFNGLAQGGNILAGSGQNFLISYTANATGGTFTGGNDVALMAIPEPSAAISLAAGLVSLLGLRRRRS